jgi:aryl-alcohol dehydrogenase-like predicted oxidoreductase
METRRLGRTGHQSSVAILGTAAFADSTPEETGRCFQLALDAGVNHLDIAPGYAKAEELVGPFIPAVRDRMFVACKTGRTQPDGVRQQAARSLELLGCDYFDLYQAHGVISLDDLDDRMPGFETIMSLRDEGTTRFVGITGHGPLAPRTHAEALRRFDLDSVMFPIYPGYWADREYRRDAEALLATCAERDVAVMVIKAAARRPWQAARDRSIATTWYEPFTEYERIERGVRFALSIPGVTGICTPGDTRLLPLALQAAGAFTPMTAAEMAAAEQDFADVELLGVPG